MKNLIGRLIYVFFDKNWYALKDLLKLPSEKRNSLYQLLEIRNKLAHPDVQGIPLNDQISHADTISRYLDFIGADANVVKSAKEIHQKLMARHVKGRDADEEQENNKDEQNRFTHQRLIK